MYVIKRVETKVRDNFAFSETFCDLESAKLEAKRLTAMYAYTDAAFIVYELKKIYEMTSQITIVIEKKKRKKGK